MQSKGPRSPVVGHQELRPGLSGAAIDERGPTIIDFDPPSNLGIPSWCQSGSIQIMNGFEAKQKIGKREKTDEKGRAALTADPLC